MENNMDKVETYFLVDYILHAKYGWKSCEYEEYNDCPICRLSLFKQDVYELPCGDVMHMSCILEGMILYQNGCQSACPACYTQHKVLEKEECPICLETITTDSKVLPCKHTFHGKCVIEAEKNGFKNCVVCGPTTSVDQSDSCPICLEELDGVTLQLICGDRFHPDCINSARQQYGWNSCPVCFTK